MHTFNNADLFFYSQLLSYLPIYIYHCPKITLILTYPGHRDIYISGWVFWCQRKRVYLSRGSSSFRSM